MLTGNIMAGNRYNFNGGWKLALGDNRHGERSDTNDAEWLNVTLPYAWNQTEAYSRNCSELSDTVMWYRKHFVLPKDAKGKRIYVEFEGVRFGAHVFINGKSVGWADNGVMAFGFDLTPYIIYNGENLLAVYVDNDWKYREHNESQIIKDGKIQLDDNGKPLTGHSAFQWNDKNFYCNYGGINKNVWLHIMPQIHQTLPLFSNLNTVGPYIYARDIIVNGGEATVCGETQVINHTKSSQALTYQLTVIDNDGRQIAQFIGDKKTIGAGDTISLHAEKRLKGLQLWSWGYGYLYTVKSSIIANGKVIDSQNIRTGFRKTAFSDGMFRLNDRVLQLKGFAQRSTNEWPAVGISVPAWMTDYSNALILGCNGNIIRWMHVTPAKQDIESLDRLGILQAMPAGDAEKDVYDHRWLQRCDVMRDAIIYNRNNPSIIFYEGGNNNISEEHMLQLKAIRDKYDPYGGRAIGSRNMLNSKVAEYGGEMLYVNKSATKPMWQMEYCRDEGIRRYWDQWSYPYHKEGEGPLYRGERAAAYNHNMDGLAIENIIRWNEYWRARPGNGTRVNAGGAKIIFSDSNTHARGEKSYRTSGDVDAMRIPKDSYFIHQAMWDGWVDTEHHHTYIIGHWNYDQQPPLVTASATLSETFLRESQDHQPSSTTCKPVYVCSTGDEVELFLNDKSLGMGRRSDTFLFTWDSVRYEPGTLRAVSYKDGAIISTDEKHTAGDPVALRMHWIGPKDTNAMRADGADIRICEIEAIDQDGNRNPLAHNMIHFTLDGNGTYLGGVSGIVSEEEKARNAAAKPSGEEGIISEGGHSKDNNAVLSHDLMLEAGVIRVMVRSTLEAGTITLTATPVASADSISADNNMPSTIKPQSLSIATEACPHKNGFYVNDNGMPIEADRTSCLPSYLSRGETPRTPSYVQRYSTINITRIEAPINQHLTHYLTDNNEATDAKMYGETSKWMSDGLLDNAWLRVTLAKAAPISQITLRMDNFRSVAYPLQVFAIRNGERTLIWEGYTAKSLGDSYLDISNPIVADTYEIRMIGPAERKEAFASMTELAAKKNVSTKASKSNILSIIEMEFHVKANAE